MQMNLFISASVITIPVATDYVAPDINVFDVKDTCVILEK